MSRALAAVITLGCKLNAADSAEIANGLRASGFDVVDAMCDADAFVLNTCSVTHVSDAKSRKLIRAVRRLAPNAVVAVTGCFPQSAGFEAAREFGADYVTGMRDADKAELIQFLSQRVEGGSRGAGSSPGQPAGQARAFIKAQEGCNDVCAFCIVPRTRGREASRTIARVVEEIDRAVEAGSREVVITGTQLGAWGRDLDKPLKPHHLISGILERAEVPRIRFSSLQPQDITPELLGLWNDPRLMPHFHLALQSGSEATLSAMRRRYTGSEFLRAAERIRAAVRGVAITTDVIAGFPGESEADFEASVALCREVGFARLHCFPYSQRSRTAAARLAGHVPHEATRRRMQRLLALGEELSLAFREGQAGTVRPVLWESEVIARCDGGPQPGTAPAWYGHTDNYIPVYTNARDLFNRVTPVQLGRVYDDGVLGSIPGEAV